LLLVIAALSRAKGFDWLQLIVFRDEKMVYQSQRLGLLNTMKMKYQLQVNAPN